MLASALHPEKAFFLITVTPLYITTALTPLAFFIKDVGMYWVPFSKITLLAQPSEPIISVPFFTVFGIVSSFIEKHLSNAFIPIVLSLAESLMSVSALQLMKAALPISVILSAITNLVIPLQLPNAPSPILFTVLPSANVTSSMYLCPSNALGAIDLTPFGITTFVKVLSSLSMYKLTSSLVSFLTL